MVQAIFPNLGDHCLDSFALGVQFSEPGVIDGFFDLGAVSATSIIIKCLKSLLDHSILNGGLSIHFYF